MSKSPEYTSALPERVTAGRRLQTLGAHCHLRVETFQLLPAVYQTLHMAVSWKLWIFLHTWRVGTAPGIVHGQDSTQQSDVKVSLAGLHDRIPAGTWRGWVVHPLCLSPTVTKGSDTLGGPGSSALLRVRECNTRAIPGLRRQQMKSVRCGLAVPLLTMPLSSRANTIESLFMFAAPWVHAMCLKVTFPE